MKTFFNYILSFVFIGILALLTIDMIILPLMTNSSEEIYIPDVRFKNIHSAQSILEEHKLQTEIIYADYNKSYGANIVLNMAPRPFTKIKEGRTIKLTVSGDKEKIIVDNYINKSLKSSIISIEKLGLELDTVIYEYNEDILKNYITSQYPKKGKILQTNDNITFVVSLGTPPNHYIVPDVINMNLTKAKETISKSGLRIGNIEYIYNEEYLYNTVISQSIASGLRLSFPKSLTLTVTTDKHEQK